MQGYMKQEITVKELIESPVFHSLLEKELAKATTAFKIRPEPKAGQKYRRSWYERMDEAHQLNSEFFIKELPLVLAKSSQLSSEIRNVILSISQPAINGYFDHVNSMEVETVTPEPTPEKPSPKKRAPKAKVEDGKKPTRKKTQVSTENAKQEEV